MNFYAAIEAGRGGLIPGALEVDREMMRRTTAHIKNGIGWIRNQLGRWGRP